MPGVKQIAGHRFGRWLVLQRAKNGNAGQAQWLCRCSCGKQNIVPGAALRAGNTLSCGCLRRDSNREWMKKNAKRIATTHGLSRTLAYASWGGMMHRCYNPKCRNYYNYGGRGIVVCKRWHSVKSFFKDMGERRKGYTLDRVDNNKGYCPSNCRWATPKTQANNRRQGKGHPIKLSEKDVRNIRESFLVARKLANKYSVNKNTIDRIRQRKTWKHVA